MRSAIPPAARRFLRPFGRVFLLLLLTFCSLGVEEAEPEWSALRGASSGQENTRRGRINRSAHAAHHLYRSAEGQDETGRAFVFEVAHFDLHYPGLAASGALAELLSVRPPLLAIDSRFNRGPPRRFL